MKVKSSIKAGQESAAFLTNEIASVQVATQHERNLGKEDSDESKEQPQSWAVIRRRSRLMRWLRFKLQRSTREICERRTAMKVKSNLKAGQSSAAILD